MWFVLEEVAAVVDFAGDVPNSVKLYSCCVTPNVPPASTVNITQIGSII